MKEPNPMDQIYDLDSHIALAEDLLQKWLSLKPPPFYVARFLKCSIEPEAKAYWYKLLEELGSPWASIFSNNRNGASNVALRLSERNGIGRLNEYVFAPYLKELKLAEEILNGILKLDQKFLSPQQEVKATECLGYVLT